MIPHFTLRRGKQDHLIIRMGDEFHLIDCNEALTKEKRFVILESGCTPAEMQEMGLSGMTIPKSDIRALTITGYGVRDDVIFYLNQKKLAFWFPEPVDQKKADDFFRGIPRKMVKSRFPIKGGKNADWRIREQNYQLYKKLRPVGWVWNVLCPLVLFLPPLIVRPIRMGWTVVGLSMIAILLDIFLPEYFSIVWFQEDSRKGKKYGQRPPQTRAVNLGIGLLILAAGFTLYIGGTYHLFDTFATFPVALAVTAVVCILLLVFAREFRENFSAWLLTILFALIFNWAAFVPHFNHVLGPEPTPCTLPIVDTHINTSGRGADHYYCTVLLEDGRELDVKVSREEYEGTQVGDTLDVQIGTGFFGIDYGLDG